MHTKPKIVLRSVQDNGATLPANLHPVLKRIYLGRDVLDAVQTDHALRHLLPVDDLKGIHTASSLIADAIRHGLRILIVGDYDADGATSCALAVRVLRAIGARQVDYLVPNRFEYGYGLAPEIVAIARQKQPDLIITVDNGIASVDGVRAAGIAGIKTIITDHHLPGAELPAADAIINPNQPGCAFASKHLAGVGVIFYLLAAVRAVLKQSNWFETQQLPAPRMADYLDLVALGTIADVVKLDHNNRILVAQGLARIRAGLACPGIMALLKVAGRDHRCVTSVDLGFFAGPRLNAAGRLDDMRIGIECLLAENEVTAMRYALQLDQFNRHRRDIESSMRELAALQLDRILGQTQQAQLPNSLCLFDAEFHEGVIGILAGRIKEQFHRPAIVFALSQEEQIKGSARSIPGLHIRDALDRIATAHPELLTRFGGHAMAAGLTIRKDDFDRFVQVFETTVSEIIDQNDLQKVLQSDGELQASDINLQFAELLRDAGPWGQGFPEPLFDGQFELLNRRIVGEHHLKMLVRTGDRCVDAIAFRTTDQEWPQRVAQVRLVYKLDVNEYNERKNVQLVVDYVEPVI